MNAKAANYFDHVAKSAATTPFEVIEYTPNAPDTNYEIREGWPADAQALLDALRRQMGELE